MIKEIDKTVFCAHEKYSGGYFYEPDGKEGEIKGRIHFWQSLETLYVFYIDSFSKYNSSEMAKAIYGLWKATKRNEKSIIVIKDEKHFIIACHRGMSVMRLFDELSQIERDKLSYEVEQSLY